jgi:hypothetical protein
MMNHCDLTNNLDMINKNRQAKGSLQGNSKLNEDQVKIIKNKLILGEKIIDIAKEFNTSYWSIYDIKRGRTWAHLKIN